MNSTLLNPTPKALAAALAKAVKEANKKLTVEHCHVTVDDAPAALAHCAESSEGFRYWRGSQPTPGGQWSFAALAWWSDSLDRKHIRVAGGRCDADAPAATDAIRDMPAVWHVFPEFCYFADQSNPVQVLLVCGCGACGTAELILWAGDRCGRCQQNGERAKECPPPATLPCSFASFTPDGRGLIYQHTPDGVAYLDLQTGKLTAAPVKSKGLGMPVVFNSQQPECLYTIDLAMHRWNWGTNKKLVPAGKRAVVEFGLIVMEEGSPNGKWIGGRYNFRPIDWSKPGNPVGKGFQFRRDRQTGGVPYTSGQFIDDGRWIGITPEGQIDAVDPATGIGTLLKPAGAFSGIDPDIKVEAHILALNWSQDLVCLAFRYSDRYSAYTLPPVLVGPIRSSGTWQPIPWLDEDRPVENLLGFTPDGRGLLSGRETNTLEFIPLDGSGSRKLSFALPDYREQVCRADFSPDGQSLILMARNARREGLGTPTDWYVRRIPYSAAAMAELFQSRKSLDERFPSNPASVDQSPRPPAESSPLAEHEFAPCTIHDDGEGQCWLSFSDFRATESIFAEAGYDGGGYAWHGVVDALVRSQAPALKRKLEFDPEGSELLVRSKKRDALQQVAKFIQSAIADPELLRSAIKDANPKLMG